VQGHGRRGHEAEPPLEQGCEARRGTGAAGRQAVGLAGPPGRERAAGGASGRARGHRARAAARGTAGGERARGRAMGLQGARDRAAGGCATGPQGGGGDGATGGAQEG
jgi:hypothetical protein